MKKYLIDTDVIIDCLRQNKSVLDFLKVYFLKEETFFYISSLTIAELFSGKSAQTKTNQTYLLKLVDNFSRVNLSQEIAVQAGKFRAKYQISLSDAIIAATAYFLKANLITFNFKDFSKIKVIKVISPRK